MQRIHKVHRGHLAGERPLHYRHTFMVNPW